MKMFSKLGFLTLLFSFLSLSCSKEDISVNDNLKTSTSADWGSNEDCPYCLPEMDLIKRVDNKGANVVLGTVEVCRTEEALCFTYTAKAGSEIGSIKIGLFATFDDLFERNNNPSPKNFIVTRNIDRTGTYTECIPVATILSVLGLENESQLYDPARMSKLYITAEAQISGGQEGGQGWAGTRVGNGKYPFDRYFIYQFAGCNNTPPPSTCTYTQGFWKNHGPNPSGNNSNEWDSGTMTLGMNLGTVNYTASQLQRIFETAVKGNGLISLAHQLIAGVIAAADALIAGLVVPPVGSGYLAPKTTSALTTALADFNEGRTGPGHCD
jgi:hypothetical protein